VRTNHEGVLHDAHVRDGSYLPVSGVPTENTYGATVYDKGSDVIHTLRHYMGDDKFFSCVKALIDEYKWNTVSTIQMRDYLSQCSGINLNDYFNDWVLTPGFPHFSIENQFVELETFGTEDFMRVTFTIRQQLHKSNHYYNNVPVVVTYFSSTGQSFKDTVLVSGPCTDHASAYVPMLTTDISVVALDFDGSLQDAITDEWRQINGTGAYDFGTAKLQVDVTKLTQPSFLRVEHNWIRPEPMRTKIPGLHLHDKRYWTISGTFARYVQTNANSATAELEYDGTDVSLDNTFITNREDSIVVMYRSKPESEWAIADSFTINTGGNVNNKIGSVTVRNIKAGQYCLAIWNSALPDTTVAEAECIYLAIEETAKAPNFDVYPNPTNETITLQFDKDMFDSVSLLDITGRRLLSQKLVTGQGTLQLNLKNYTAGIYIVELTGPRATQITRKVVKQ
ncbi:MAG TPA: T9SS type A sorting domain-containing protein, partial [Chitinophagales bacterium]|nr:T9SS type A sorting domain-containing protein [Chitinophagales bacterium]